MNGGYLLPRWRGSVTRANTVKEKIQEIVSFLLSVYLGKIIIFVRLSRINKL